MKIGKRFSLVVTIWGLSTILEAKPSIQKPVICTPAMFDCQTLILLPEMDDCPKEEPTRPQVADGGSPIGQPCQPLLKGESHRARDVQAPTAESIKK